MRKQCKRESGVNGANLRNSMQTRQVSSLAVARILRDVEALLADGYEGELSAQIARRTGYCETTVDHALAVSWRGERAARATLKSAVRGGIDESDRAFWATVEDAA